MRSAQFLSLIYSHLIMWAGTCTRSQALGGGQSFSSCSWSIIIFPEVSSLATAAFWWTKNVVSTRMVSGRLPWDMMRDHHDMRETHIFPFLHHDPCPFCDEVVIFISGAQRLTNCCCVMDKHKRVKAGVQVDFVHKIDAKNDCYAQERW